MRRENKIVYKCIFTDLSEEYMHLNRDILYWDDLTKHQEMSDDFIITHKEYIDWKRFELDKKISKKIIDNCIKEIKRWFK